MRATPLIAFTLIGLCPMALGQHCNTAGYINQSYVAGYNLISNPLQTTNHHLSALFLYGVPHGTRISLWNPAARNFDPTAVWKPLTHGIAISLNNFLLINAANNANAFYRLRKQ